MDPNVKAVVEDCTRGSEEQRLSFPDVIARLRAAGVERYHADLIRSEKTYYLPNGEFHAVAVAATAKIPAPALSAAGIAAALRAIQGSKIGYKEFCARIIEAGCAGYFVCLAGRKALYYGRAGESYIEPFPDAI